MTQGTPQLLSSGFETASVLVSSGLLSAPWEIITQLNPENRPNQHLFWIKHNNGSDLTIIAFATSLNHVKPDLLPSTDMMDNPFEFLCSKKNPQFSLNQSVMSLFNDNLQTLGQLKSEIDLKKPVIVTGQGVGGSIASLFTLWLLEKMTPSDKRPLCITFGSPLVGDKSLQEAIARSSNWNSCFLHVVHPHDPMLSTFISDVKYRPFGTFLLCSNSGSTCSENPDSILRLFKEIRSLQQRLTFLGYGNIVERLNSKSIQKESYVPSIPQTLLQTSFALQLQALGFSNSQLSQDLERQEVLLTLNKRKRSIPQKKLDEMKIYMAYLEWYKKFCKNSGRGYYDCYKSEYFPRDLDVVMYIRILNNYWKDMVEEVEKQPQKEGVAFRLRWLYAGTNYRRMVEPLDIAHYYKDGGQEYRDQGRSEHYKQLQKWQEDDKKEHDKKEEEKNRNNVQSILTIDSCFWARVEEAMCALRKCMDSKSTAAVKEVEAAKLDDFEEYVYDSLRKYEVSPEIFLESCSYMEWWRGYMMFKGGSSYGSRLANFMKNYGKYGEGNYDFPSE